MKIHTQVSSTKKLLVRWGKKNKKKKKKRGGGLWMLRGEGKKYKVNNSNPFKLKIKSFQDNYNIKQLKN